jgi:hypothetical protein
MGSKYIRINIFGPLRRLRWSSAHDSHGRSDFEFFWPLSVKRAADKIMGAMVVKGTGNNASEGGTAVAPPREVVSPDANDVRAELDRILDSAPFRNSKRHSALLRYLVDQTLEGKADELKERTVGVEVFDRAPDYDSNTDHVVRSSASEIRKRLAMYYQESGAEARVRIDLHPGGYVPSFRVHRVPSSPPVAAKIASEEPSRLLTPVNSRRHWVGYCATAIGAAAVTFGISDLLSWHAPTALDRFWRPLVSQPGAIVICVGRYLGAGSTPSGGASQGGIGDSQSQSDQGPPPLVTGGNAIALARMAGELQMRGKTFRVFLAASASFDDIQERGAVLIGGSNNDWTIQLLKNLRFRIEGSGGPIIDTATNPVKIWTSIAGPVRGTFLRDYGLIVRCKSSQTGKMIVVAGGTRYYGTMAASQFLSDETLMSELQARAPKGWENMNMEVVLVTDIVRGLGGRPTIVATYFW